MQADKLITVDKLREKLKAIFLQRQTIGHLAFAQIKARYNGNGLGIWVVALNPLLVMVAVSFVFTQVIRLEIKNFPLFALAGIFPWMFFSSALSEAASAIVAQQAMLRQFNFPKEHLALASILANFLIFLIGWIIILPIFLFFNSGIILVLPALFIGMLLMFVFVSGIGMMLSVLNVIFRDIGYLLGTILMFWFWITPVFYSIEMVPEKMRWICQLNPMTWFILFHREILLQALLPGWKIILILGVISFSSFLLGLSIVLGFEKELLKKI